MSMRVLAVGLVGGCCAAWGSQSVDNPYKIIWDRNPFGLRPPPPVETNVPPPPPAPPANITLTGVIKLDGVKHAVLLIQEPGKPQAVSAVVAEGKQTQGSLVDILEVDDAENKVKIRQGGVESTLVFKDVKPSSAAVPVMVPGRPLPTPMTMPTAGATTFNPGGGVPTVIPGAPGYSTPLPQPVYAPPATGLRSIPSRTPRLTPTTPGPQAYGISTPGQPLTAEESAAMVIINTQLNADKVARKEMPPFPPVPGFTDQQPAAQAVPTVPTIPTPGYPPTTRR